MSSICCCFQGLSCVCSTVNLISCCFSSALGSKTGVSPRTTKLFYILLFGCATILALILRFNSENFDLGPLTVNCASSNSTSGVYCKGDASVFRISLVLTLFFLFMAVVSFFSESFHRGFWAIKLTLLIGGIVGCFFIPNTAFDNNGYAWVARFGSIIFLTLQILVLIDFAYQWNENWVARAYEGALTEYDAATHPNWLIAILACAFCMYALCITIIALLYAFYGQCGVGIAFTTVTLILILLVTLLSLFRDKVVPNHQGAILPAAIVSLYSIYLCWAALESNPTAQCRPNSQDADQASATMVIGIIWISITLCWTSFSVTQNAVHLVSGDDLEKPAPLEDASGKANSNNATNFSSSSANSKPLVDVNRRGDEESNNNNNSGSEDDDSPVYSSDRPFVFHLIMLTASMYLGMLLTNWGSGSGGSSLALVGNASMYVKFASLLVVLLLYGWTLIAPLVLSKRVFD